MIVSEIMELTNQRRGTVEQFRSELLKYKIISNNESLDARAVQVFQKSIFYYKDGNEQTWSDAMQRAIQEEYAEEMDVPFHWTSKIILRHLIWEIENNLVKVVDPNSMNEDFHIIYEVMIDNFKELGKSIESYKGSFGTDGNPVITYKCIGADYIYYIVGKYNRFTDSEDIHVFYNNGARFNIMKCSHICGGRYNNGIFAELNSICRKKLNR